MNVNVNQRNDARRIREVLGEMLECAVDPVIVTDDTGAVALWNEHASSTFG